MIWRSFASHNNLFIQLLQLQHFVFRVAPKISEILYVKSMSCLLRIISFSVKSLRIESLPYFSSYQIFRKKILKVPPAVEQESLTSSSKIAFYDVGWVIMGESWAVGQGSGMFSANQNIGFYLTWLTLVANQKSLFVPS